MIGRVQQATQGVIGFAMYDRDQEGGRVHSRIAQDLRIHP
jgi:hypothetical protein